MSGVSEKTAKRALDDLVNAGFLVRTGYGRPSNITDYQITIPESATAVTPEGPLVHVEFYGRQS
jgi:predicted ArsR family transcriptional regulator